MRVVFDRYMYHDSDVETIEEVEAREWNSAEEFLTFLSESNLSAAINRFEDNVLHLQHPIAAL